MLHNALLLVVLSCPISLPGLWRQKFCFIYLCVTHSVCPSPAHIWYGMEYQSICRQPDPTLRWREQALRREVSRELCKSSPSGHLLVSLDGLLCCLELCCLHSPPDSYEAVPQSSDPPTPVFPYLYQLLHWSWLDFPFPRLDTNWNCCCSPASPFNVPASSNSFVLECYTIHNSGSLLWSTLGVPAIAYLALLHQTNGCWTIQKNECWH